jgi:hypothetical protein
MVMGEERLRRARLGFAGKCSIRNDVAIIKIPKCASSSINLATKGWMHCFSDELGPGLTITGIVRDPVERWVSGATQYLMLLPEREGYWILRAWMDEYTWPELSGRPVVDMHTCPQSWHYEGLPVMKLFKFRNFEGLWDYLAGKGVPLPVMDHVSHNRWDYHVEVKSKIQGVIDDNPFFRESLEKFYKDDMELFQNAE